MNLDKFKTLILGGVVALTANMPLHAEELTQISANSHESSELKQSIDYKQFKNLNHNEWNEPKKISNNLQKELQEYQKLGLYNII